MNVPENKLGLLLFLVSRAHHNLAGKLFEQIGLYRGQPPVLFKLGEQDGIPQSALAEKMEVTPATITNMLKRMESSGFLVRVRDQQDSRISRVFLTDAGKMVLKQVKALADEMDQIAFSGFSSEEQKMMERFLKRIHTNLTR